MKNQHYFKKRDDYLFVLFIISIRNINHLSDTEIFELLGYSKINKIDFKIVRLEDDLDQIRYQGEIDCYVVNEGEWMTIFDTTYRIYNDFRNRVKLEKLSYEYDVFYATVGDIDDSFDYSYYKDGVLRRKYVVSSVDFSSLKIEKDIGVFLEGEKEILLEKDPEKKVIHAAETAGVPLKYNDSMRAYNMNFPPFGSAFLEADEH